MAEHTEAAPAQAPASYDFNKLHDACVAGKDGEAALNAAVYADTVPRPATRAAPAPDQGDEASGLGKAELRKLLDERGVAYETDANLPRLAELVRQNPAPLTVSAPPAPGEREA